MIYLQRIVSARLLVALVLRGKYKAEHVTVTAYAGSNPSPLKLASHRDFTQNHCHRTQPIISSYSIVTVLHSLHVLKVTMIV